MNGPLSNAQYEEMIATAKAKGWEIRKHLNTGTIMARDPNTPFLDLAVPRSTRRLLDVLWRQSVVVFDPKTAKLA
jgi:hypothetical protein